MRQHRTALDCPSLAELQKWMRWVITDPRGVDAALSDPPALDIPSRERYLAPVLNGLPWITDEKPLSPSQRLDIYAEGYFARIAEVLEQDFSAVHRQVGEAAFLKIVADYLKTHPSRSPNIGDVGSRLPEFLRVHELTRELLWISELALMEWEITQSFYADDVPRLDAGTLGSVGAEAWPQARFELDPSVRLLRLHSNTDEIWRDAEASWTEGARFVLVYREGDSVDITQLDPGSFRVLQWMQEQLSLEQICERLGESGEELPPLMTWFQQWISSGLIRAIRFGEDELL
jgi:hypothetical protein